MRPSVVDPKRSSPMPVKPFDGAVRHVPQSITSLPTYSATPGFSRSRGTSKTPLPAANGQKARPSLVLAPLEGWLPLVCLGVALYCVIASMQAAKWVGHDTLFPWGGLLGMVLGLIIAKLPKGPQSLFHLGTCLLGFWFALWLTSFAAYHVSITLVLNGLRSVFTGSLLDLPPGLAEALFFFYLTFLTFFLGYFGCWLVYRARLPWLVALIYSAILLVNLNYVKQDAVYLVCILGGALMLLVARVHLAAQVAQWRRDGLYTDRSWLRGMAWRCMQVTCGFTLCTLLLSSFLPFAQQTQSGVVFWDHLDNGWNNLVNGRFSWRDPSSLFNGTPSNFFDKRLHITGQVNLPKGEVLSYTSSNQKPQYLLGFTFNDFDGHLSWKSSLDQNATQYFEPNAMLQSDVPQVSDDQITTRVILTQPPGGPAYIFAPEQPVRFDVSTAISYDVTANTWMQQNPLQKGEAYTVISQLPPHDPDLLATVPLPERDPAFWNADTNYDIIKGSYTQIDEKDYSPRVLTQVKQWVGNTSTTYGALKALEQHLSDQTQFTYSVSNPDIVSSANVVDWLLQNKRGYCTYYASAMIVMARMLHIPTRMANGFSSGHFDEQRKAWIVDGQDAHSWVQAYFPNLGWVNFEPTPGYSTTSPAKPTPTVTPTQPAQKPTPTSTATAKNTPLTHHQPTPPPDAATGGTGVQWAGGISDAVLLNIALLALLIAVVIFGLALFTSWWRGLYANSTFIASTYWRFCWLASKFGFAPRPWQTPYEYSGMLSQQAPGQVAPLWRLTELFVRDRWGPRSSVPSPDASAETRRMQPALRGMAWHLLLNKWRRT
ncbi:transglutaminase domain-containing protein [Ktedonobacter sp. SOSP1-52]|uniref:transglutaminase TgpA family protein n=1 Tax=Ktedonobacter sp. SOSP1-52 TaxID=2778366 RepID=UPI00191547CE|nr:transglutaminase domain-containing protein [Ktedonobacter sp. SOSP1-52]